MFIVLSAWFLLGAKGNEARVPQAAAPTAGNGCVVAATAAEIVEALNIPDNREICIVLIQCVFPLLFSQHFVVCSGHVAGVSSDLSLTLALRCGSAVAGERSSA